MASALITAMIRINIINIKITLKILFFFNIYNNIKGIVFFLFNYSRYSHIVSDWKLPFLIVVKKWMKNYVEITFARNLLIKSVVKEDEHFVRPKVCLVFRPR